MTGSAVEKVEVGACAEEGGTAHYVAVEEGEGGEDLDGSEPVTEY